MGSMSSVCAWATLHLTSKATTPIQVNPRRSNKGVQVELEGGLLHSCYLRLLGCFTAVGVRHEFLNTEVCPQGRL